MAASLGFPSKRRCQLQWWLSTAPALATLDRWIPLIVAHHCQVGFLGDSVTFVHKSMFWEPNPLWIESKSPYSGVPFFSLPLCSIDVSTKPLGVRQNQQPIQHFPMKRHASHRRKRWWTSNAPDFFRSKKGPVSCQFQLYKVRLFAVHHHFGVILVFSSCDVQEKTSKRKSRLSLSFTLGVFSYIFFLILFCRAFYQPLVTSHLLCLQKRWSLLTQALALGGSQSIHKPSWGGDGPPRMIRK